MIRNILSLKYGLLVCLFFAHNFTSLAQQPSFTINELLKIVKPEQPRILYTFELQARLDSLVLKDSVSNKELKRLIASAQELVDLPTIDYSLDSSATELYNRVITLSFAARHTGRKQFFVKLMKELDKAVSLKDWKPEDFSNLSLMTLSVSLGYDWVNTSLNGEIKKNYSTAIYNKGLKYGLIEYEKVKPGQEVKAGDWVYTPSSRSVANNSAMLIGALAVARDFPQIAANTIFYASNSLSGTLRNFPLSIVQEIKPAEEVNLFLTVSALKFALDKDFGLSSSLGFKLIKQSFEESGKNNLKPNQQFVYKYLLNKK